MKIRVEITDAGKAKIARRVNRLVCKMPQGGRHGTKKGAKGYRRREKHRGRRDE